MLKIASLLGLTFVVVGCAAAPEAPEEKKASASHLDNGACLLASTVAAAATGAAVELATVTATCAAATLVTVEGELVCLAPAAGSAASWLTGLLAGAVMYLTCDGGATTSEVRVADDPNAAATPTTNTSTNVNGKVCNEADMAADCSCAQLADLYATQKELCEGGKCDFSMMCEDVERQMAVTRNCINARRDVQLCYRRPDFDGHQTQINQLCQVFRDCTSVAVSCEASSTFPELPSPCAF